MEQMYLPGMEPGGVRIPGAVSGLSFLFGASKVYQPIDTTASLKLEGVVLEFNPAFFFHIGLCRFCRKASAAGYIWCDGCQAEAEAADEEAILTSAWWWESTLHHLDSEQ